MIKNKIIN